MMSKTHLAAGMAAALTISPIANINDCLLVLACGALGGVIPDVDILDDDYKKDALLGEGISFGLLFLCVVINFFNGGTILERVMEHKYLAILGILGFCLLWVIGFISEHREFTHSFLSMILFSVSVAFVDLSLFIPFSAGYFSHLMLDILNKKEIRLFFPREKGICLGLCYANKAGNTILMVLGFVATIYMFIYRLSVLQ